jgi:hypothetical protein
MSRLDDRVVAAINQLAGDGSGPVLDMAALRAGRRRRRLVRATAVAVACAAVVAVAGGFGALRNTAGGSHLPATGPSPTRTFSLAGDPLMQTWEMTALAFGLPVLRTDGHPPRLTTCITDPLTWGSAQTAAATYVSPNHPGKRFNEFVLKYSGATAAYQALADAWTQVQHCPKAPHAQDFGSRSPRGWATPVDQVWVWERFFTPQRADQQPGYNCLTVARDGNVVVVIENTGTSNDGSGELMGEAFKRAIPERR